MAVRDCCTGRAHLHILDSEFGDTAYSLWVHHGCILILRTVGWVCSTLLVSPGAPRLPFWFKIKTEVDIGKALATVQYYFDLNDTHDFCSTSFSKKGTVIMTDSKCEVTARPKFVPSANSPGENQIACMSFDWATVLNSTAAIRHHSLYRTVASRNPS